MKKIVFSIFVSFSFLYVLKKIVVNNEPGLSLNCPYLLGKSEAHFPYKIVLIKKKSVLFSPDRVR